MEKYNELVALVESTKVDVEKFYLKNNKAAGSRVRKNMQILKGLAQEVRIDILKGSSSTEE